MIKKLFIPLLVLLFILLPASYAQAVFDPLQDVCATTRVVDGKKVANPSASSPACQQAKAQASSGANPIAGPDGLLQKAADLVAVLTGIIGVIIIIAGGITFMTAGGTPGGQRAGDNPNRIKKAQSMIFAAIGGMVVVALAWTIVTFVVQRFIK